MKFTPREWEIIKHRLEASGAIADALTDYTPGEKPAVFVSWQDVQDRADKLCIRNPVYFDILDTIDQKIICDACDGSTFFSDIDDAVENGELSRGDALAFHRAANSLEKKLKVQIPRD